MKSHDEVVDLKKSLEDDYRSRHEDLRRLRDIYQSRFWETADADSRSVTSVFKDLRGMASDTGPDIKIVHNICWEIVTKYQTFLSPAPQCRVYVDPPESEKRKAQATKKERYIYGCWGENLLPKKLTKVGWYLPTMGDCFLGIFPDFDKNVPRMLVRSPEHAFPIPSVEDGLDGVIFRQEIRESQAIRQFPKYVPRANRKQSVLQRVAGGMKTRPSDPMVEVIEYSDATEFDRFIDGVRVAGIEHGLGFNMFDQVQFIHVPDEVWGHGAIEAFVSMNEMQNALYSLVFQGIFNNIFPTLVLTDPYKAPEQIPAGGGGVLPLNAGGSAEYIAPPLQGLNMAEQILGLNDHNIRRGAGQPGVNSGDSPASSIVTGAAVNALQGAATGATIEMVQGVGIGQALQAWNMKAIVMGQQEFREDNINLFGLLPSTHLEINSKQFALTLKGKDLIGSPRNEVVFSPHLSDHEKLVMGLQGLGAGLWSKKYIREQMGLPDNEAMVEEILGEQFEDGVLASVMQEFQAAPDEAGADRGASRGAAFIEGLPAPTPHPLVADTALQAAAPAGPGGAPAGPGGRLVGPAGPGGTGQDLSPPLRLPPGSPPPGGTAPAPAPAAQASSNTISLNDVASAFSQLKGIKGRVFLVGEIAARGETTGDIEVALTADDRQVIAQQLSQYAARFQFHHVTGEPQEQFVEVTPGAVPQPGGPQQVAA